MPGCAAERCAAAHSLAAQGLCRCSSHRARACASSQVPCSAAVVLAWVAVTLSMAFLKHRGSDASLASQTPRCSPQLLWQQPPEALHEDTKGYCV